VARQHFVVDLEDELSTWQAWGPQSVSKCTNQVICKWIRPW